METVACGKDNLSIVRRIVAFRPLLCCVNAFTVTPGRAFEVGLLGSASGGPLLLRMAQLRGECVAFERKSRAGEIKADGEEGLGGAAFFPFPLALLSPPSPPPLLFSFFSFADEMAAEIAAIDRSASFQLEDCCSRRLLHILTPPRCLLGAELWSCLDIDGSASH